MRLALWTVLGIWFPGEISNGGLCAQWSWWEEVVKRESRGLDKRKGSW